MDGHKVDLSRAGVNLPPRNAADSPERLVHGRERNRGRGVRGADAPVMTGDQGCCQVNGSQATTYLSSRRRPFSFLASDDEPLEDESEDDADIFVRINNPGSCPHLDE